MSGVWPRGSNWGTIGLPQMSAIGVVARRTSGSFVAEVVAVVGAHDDGGGVPQILRVEFIEELAEPVIDHRQLGAVVVADLAGLGLGDRAGRRTADDVRRPHEPAHREVVRRQWDVVVHRRPRLGRVERFVRVELVDEQHPPIVRRRFVPQPRRRSLPSCAGRGSPPRRGTTCGCRRSDADRTTGRRYRAGRAGTSHRRRRW